MVIGGLVLLVVLVMLGAPLWVALIGGASVSLLIGYEIDPLVVTSLVYNKVNVSTLLAVPLFIFLGELLHLGGGAKPLIVFLLRFMGRIPGGPAYAVIIGCAVVAAMSSTAIAAVAGFAPIVVPMMMEMGYSRKFSVGLLIAAASLGPTIPPSIPLIVFGFITETSVKDLYAAAFLPGALLAALLAVTVFVHSRRGHYAMPPPSSWGERWQALWKALPVLLMPVVILVPIYVGWDTPTEAAGIGVAYCLLLGFVFYRELTLKKVWQASLRSARITSMVFAILMGAVLVNLVLGYMEVPQDIGDGVANMGLSRAPFLLLVIVLYLAMGAFLDPTAILLVVSPMLMPTLAELGISPVLYGILVVISIEIGAITPPYGFTLFTASAVLREDFGFIARACFLFYPALIIGQVMIAYIPQIALFLPGG